MFKKCKKIMIMFVMMAVLITMAVPVHAINRGIDQFPIGIFVSPPSDYTNLTRYQEIKDMNTTFVLMGNDINNYEKNDAAITNAAAVGLKVFSNDVKLTWANTKLDQTISGHGQFVRNGYSLGQTFITPPGKDCAIETVQLYIDYTNWTAGRTLTLSIYDSPAKNTLIGNDSITGPGTTLYPVFKIAKAVVPSTSYYWELTSNSSENIGWVCGSTSGVYSGGQAYYNGTAANTDFWFKIQFPQRMYNGTTSPLTEDINAIVNNYSSNSAVAGYNIIDEPYADQLTRVFDTVDRFRQADPTRSTYVNLFPDYLIDINGNADFGFGSIHGTYVTPNQSLGQTFTTNSVTNTIPTIQIWADRNQWSANETLTLKLWNSPSKTSLIAQSTIYGVPSSNYPRFTLNASVSPNTSYYWELIHGGGDDNSVGWVCTSSNGVDWERNGSGYVNGVLQNYDFWFAIDQDITPTSWEDYVYRWAKERPDFFMYDYYPFNYNGTFKNSYYKSMEIVRNQTLKAQIPFWSYIQTCSVPYDIKMTNENEIRYNVYTNLAYGAKGISYFLYWTAYGVTGIFSDTGVKDTSVYNASKNVNAEILKLGPTLTGLNSQAVYHTATTQLASPDSNNVTQLPANFFFKPTDTTSPLVIGYFMNSSGAKYIMVVNRDYINSRTVTFQLDPNNKPSTMKEVSKTTGSEVSTNYNSSSGQLSASFNPGEGRLYALPVGY